MGPQAEADGRTASAPSGVSSVPKTSPKRVPGSIYHNGISDRLRYVNADAGCGWGRKNLIRDGAVLR